LGLAGCRTRSSAKLVLSVFAPWVLNALYILADARSAHTVPLAIACLATLVNRLVSVVFRSLHMPQIGLSRQGLSAAVTLAIGVPLVRELGITGAELELIVAQLFWCVVYLWALKHISADWTRRVDGIRVAHALADA